MKTSFKTLFASTLATILLLSVTTFTGLAGTSPIQKVIVKGNAKVYLIQRDQESIKIYNSYNPEKTSVKIKGASLLINSTENEPVTIMVYVKDIYRIDASNTSRVQTSGQFNLNFLQIFVSDDASANINANTKGLYTVVKDQAKLKLSGTSNDHILVRSKTSKLKMDKMACLKTSLSYIDTKLAIDSTKPLNKNVMVIKGR